MACTNSDFEDLLQGPHHYLAELHAVLVSLNLCPYTRPLHQSSCPFLSVALCATDRLIDLINAQISSEFPSNRTRPVTLNN